MRVEDGAAALSVEILKGGKQAAGQAPGVNRGG